MANAKIIAQKEEEVKKLAEKIKSAKVVVMADYRGITVEDVTKLRADLRAVNAEYVVIKNNITRRALKEAGIEGVEDSVLEGPTALIIGQEEYLSPIKALYAYVKEHDFYKIKSGIVEGKVSSADEIITLAKLPSREELIAKLAGALLGNITKLAVAVNQVKEQKENA